MPAWNTFVSLDSLYCSTSLARETMNPSLRLLVESLGLLLFLYKMMLFRFRVRPSHLWSYDECVGRDATQIFTPTDDPPPYSHTSHTYPCTEGVELPEGTSRWSAHAHAGSIHPIRLQDVSSVFVFSLDELPPYEAVMEQQNRTIPLIANDDVKHTAE
ncbi:hypothetical protein AMELA_G00030320 [Ameiurus melas]|uniref:Uncharacterized protein n=1 Tax=Ameiurus melas TaxID=219545 RepID=A0A7J6B7C9_AMEME|nr:hypothetical protein AMELA_G00030320 [Ameiurus melas]